MKITLSAMRRGTLMPKTYKDRDEVMAACREGKVFACKSHGVVLIVAIITLIIGIANDCVGIVVYIQAAKFLDIRAEAIILIITGTILLTADVIFWIIYRARSLLVGPTGILICLFFTRSFLPWNQIVNVEWKERDSRSYAQVKITTVDGILDNTIVDSMYSSIDVLPHKGIQGIFDMIESYHQWSRTSSTSSNA